MSLSTLTAGSRRRSIRPPTASASSPMAVGATSARAGPGMATTWTTTPTTWRNSSSTLEDATLVGFLDRWRGSRAVLSADTVLVGSPGSP
jgi:hypothetical protein